MTNTIALALESFCYACEETTKGTAVYPTAAAQKIITAGHADINQQPTFTDSEEVSNTLDLLDRFQDQVTNGTWKVPMYIRPSGTAGTAPMGAILYESLMGLATNTPVTSEAYSQATTKPSFTLWAKKGHTVFWGAGAVAESGSFNNTNKGAAMADMSGGFMAMGWAGTDAANGATTAGDGAGYLVDLVAGYAIGDTAIHVDTGTGAILEGDCVTFAGDATVYFIETGFAGDDDGDIVLRAPGLTQTLADDVAMTIAGNSKITVDDGKKFSANGRVQIAADTNTNAGYEIISVSGNKLFMSEAVTCADDAVVKGFLPVYTAVGAPVENKNLSITFDGTAKTLKSLKIDINSPVEWQNNEITSSGYVEDYVENRRSIKVTADLLLRESDVDFFYDAYNNTQVAIVAAVNDGAGKICTISLPYTELEVPSVTATTPTVSLSITGTCLGSSGEDSATITFT